MCCFENTCKNKIGNLYLQNFTFPSARWLYWFYIKLSPPHFTTKLRPCTAQNFVLITIQLKNKTVARMKSTAIRSWRTAENSLFETNIFRREHMLHRRRFPVMQTCGARSFAGNSYFTDHSSNALFVTKHSLCSHQFRPEETASRC